MKTFQLRKTILMKAHFMCRIILFLLIFLSATNRAVAADAFDATVIEVKTVEVERENNQTLINEATRAIEEQLGILRENHALNAPRTEFETDEDYAARLSELDGIIAQRRLELEDENLSSLQERLRESATELGRLYQTVFFTSDITVTLDNYDVDAESFSATIELNDQSFSAILYIDRNDAPILKQNWGQVIKTAYLSIDPGYRRALVQVKLEYPPLWKEAATFAFDEVYSLGNNNRAVHFSADGKYLATGSIAKENDDGFVSIWEVSSGRQLRQTTHNGNVNAVAFSPDGQYLATGDARYLRVWQVNDGSLSWKKYKKYGFGAGFYARFYAVAFNPNGSYVAAGTTVGTYVIKTQTGNELWGRSRSADMFGNKRAATHTVAFTPDGRHLATGDTNRDALVWDVTRAEPILQINHSDTVWCLDISPDGRYLAAGDNQGNVSISEVSSGIKLREMEHVGGWIGAVAYSPDGAYLAVGHENNIITFYRMPTGEITIDSRITREKILRTSEPVYELAWHPNGHLISDGNKVYRTLLAPVYTDLVGKPLDTRRDVNRDGVVDVDDLVLVASNFGKSFKGDASPNPDVNRDGIVNRQDVMEIIVALEEMADVLAAPSQTNPTLTAETLKYWINQAKTLNNKDETFQKGIRVLEQLLATWRQAETTPAATALLLNYPNPFNPETWIPYQLGHAADVTLTVYDMKGVVVRQIDLGHRPAGYYTDKTKALYWDGRNGVGEQVGSGVYFYHLSAGNYSKTRRLVILK